MLEWSPWNASEEMERADDEDPGESVVKPETDQYSELYVADVIQGIQPEWNEDLGMTGRRDPDALPPANAFQYVMHWVYDMTIALGRGNVLFALKAGLLTGMWHD